VRTDAEPGSPDFGRLEICTCRQGAVMRHVRDRLFSLSHLDELKGLTFDSFQPRGQIGLGERQARSLEIAYNTARQYAAREAMAVARPTWPPQSPTLLLVWVCPPFS
jgi:DNA replication protein DnaC